MTLDTIAKLEAMREDLRHAQIEGLLTVDEAVLTLVKAVDALTYVMINQLRQGDVIDPKGGQDFDGPAEHTVHVLGATFGGDVELVLDGTFHRLAAGSTVTL